MISYFDDVAGSLTFEDTKILGVLLDRDATARFKAIQAGNLKDAATFTEANFRKVTTRLLAQKFIESNADYKERSLYITPYGMAALQKILSMVEVG